MSNNENSTTTHRMIQTETAVFGGGCFWGVEELIRSLPGVLKTEVGYCGGTILNPVYEQVKTGRTGHAEVVKVDFNPHQISFEQLLEQFFRLHDPTTLNQQGNDIGTQYRSVIFFQTPEQEITAQKVKEKVQQSGKWKNPVVTEITPMASFYRAEEYHQKYLVKNPNGYTCHFWR